MLNIQIRDSWYNCHWIRHKKILWQDPGSNIYGDNCKCVDVEGEGENIRWHEQEQAQREAVRIVTNSEHVATAIKAGKARDVQGIVMEGEKVQKLNKLEKF